MAGEPGNFDPLGGLESLSSLEADAATMHELFITLVKAGFLERQALVLVSLLIGDQSDDDDEVYFVQPSLQMSVEEEIDDEDDNSGDGDDVDDEGADGD